MDKILLLKFLVFVCVPLVIGGTVLGAIFGGIGYYASGWLEIFTTEQQKITFYLFLGLGFFAGVVGATQSLIVFVSKRGRS